MDQQTKNLPLKTLLREPKIHNPKKAVRRSKWIWRSAIGCLVSLGLMSIAVNCSTPLNRYICENDLDCKGSGVDGRCEDNDLCSFPAAECESTFRYGNSSGDLSGQCTDPLKTPIDAGPDAPLDDSGTPPDRVNLSIDLALGLDHSCVLERAEDGYTSFCWGDNSSGQLGADADPGHLGGGVRRNFGAAGDVIGISAGGQSTCLFSNESYDCFGSDENSRLGGAINSKHILTEFALGPTSRSSVCLIGHSQASPDGISCWGGNSNGQATADGQASDSLAEPNQVLVGQYSQLAIGERHACALSGDGMSVNADVFCWGANSSSQMALPRVMGDDEKIPSHKIVMPNNRYATQLAAGFNHNCIIDEEESLAYCWGDNQFEQTTGRSGNAQVAPRKVDGEDTEVGALALGHNHSCALGLDKRVYCWGSDEFGQLGHNVSSPNGDGLQTPVANLQGVDRIASGANHICAHVPDEGVYCWGSNGKHQVNTSDTTYFETPVLVYEEPPPE